MSTESGSAQASEPRRRRDTDPLQMTEHEKRVAEWEARHDVAARGHRAPPDVLQHYFAHERLAHPGRSGHTERFPGAGSSRTAPGPAVPPREQPEDRGRWWRGLFRFG